MTNCTGRYQKINDEFAHPSAAQNDSVQSTDISEAQPIESTPLPEKEPDSRCWKYTKIALYIVGFAILVPLVIILSGGEFGDCGNCGGGGGDCNCNGCCDCCDDKKKNTQEQDEQIAVATAEMSVI